MDSPDLSLIRLDDILSYLDKSRSDIIETSDKSPVTSPFDSIIGDSILEDDMDSIKTTPVSKSGTRKSPSSLDSPIKKKKAQRNFMLKLELIDKNSMLKRLNTNESGKKSKLVLRSQTVKRFRKKVDNDKNFDTFPSNLKRKLHNKENHEVSSVEKSSIKIKRPVVKLKIPENFEEIIDIPEIHPIFRKFGLTHEDKMTVKKSVEKSGKRGQIAHYHKKRQLQKE